MDVVFVNPPNHPFTPPGILIEPIDALGLASFAQAAGHRVRLLDMDVRQIAPSGMDAALGGAWPDAVVVVCDYHIPLHADGANGQVGAIVAEARRHGCRTMVGGKLATFGGDGDLRSAGANVYAAHDAEPVLAAALALPEWTPETLAGVPNAAVRRADGGYVRTPAARPRVDLASLPEADRSLVQLSDYIDVRTVLSSRGCHQRCSFCHVPGFWGGWHGMSGGVRRRRDRSSGDTAWRQESPVSQRQRSGQPEADGPHRQPRRRPRPGRRARVPGVGLPVQPRTPGDDARRRVPVDPLRGGERR